MQASDRVLAWRYARALFLAAADKKEDGRVQQDIDLSRRELLEAMPTLRHPRVSTADKKKRIEDLVGKKVSPVTLKFLELLIDKKRFELLPMVASDLGKLVAEKNNVAKAVVRSAKPLSADAQQKLKDKLKNFAGKNIELEVKEDPELIGGVVVRIGDWVLDSSLRGQLRQMKEALS